jgi:hypothetical protein
VASRQNAPALTEPPFFGSTSPNIREKSEL